MAWQEHTIDSVDEYRALRGDAIPAMYAKSMTHIDEHIRRFLALTSFVAVASIDANGNMDISPKGDPPGFITVIDDTTIVIPERAGNRRADTFTNVLQNPSVGIICFVPGMDETMRLNGRASITTDAELLATMEVDGHVPVLGLVVEVEEAFIHCGKSLIRGRVWDPDARIDRSIYPSVGEVMFDHGKLERYGFTRESTIHCAIDDYASNVYPTVEE